MFKNILIPIDLSYKENLNRLLSAANKIIKENKVNQIALLYINQNMIHGSVYPNIDDNNQHEHEKGALSELKEIANKWDLPLNNISYHVRRGSPHEQILDEAKKVKADVIVMMARKPNMSNYFIGSTAERVVRHAKTSVFIVRNRTYNQD